MAVKLRVGELARHHGLTISALAKRAGVATNTAHALYTARATRIDLQTLDRIAAALAVEPGEVFSRNQAQQSDAPVGMRTEATMDPIQIGQRVRVTDPRLVHFRQAGVVVALHATEGCSVHLDYDGDRPDAHIFFHAEELEAASEATERPEHQRHASAAVDPDRGGEHTPPDRSLSDALA